MPSCTSEFCLLPVDEELELRSRYRLFLKFVVKMSFPVILSAQPIMSYLLGDSEHPSHDFSVESSAGLIFKVKDISSEA